MCEGQGTDTPGALTAKDIRESVGTVSLRGIPPRVQPGGCQQMRRAQHSLCQPPLPVTLVEMKGTKACWFFLHCSKAAMLNRGILGLCRVSLSFGSSFSVI